MNNRIAIVGISGSGKSTLANRIGKKLNRPVVHLDKLYWDVGWKERYASKEEFRKVVHDLTDTPNWIIDGNYRSTLDVRLESADTIIHLDFPKWLCLLRVVKRTFNRKQPFDKAEGVKNKVNWELIKFIITYPTHEMRERVGKYGEVKNVLIAKNTGEVEEVLRKIN